MNFLGKLLRAALVTALILLLILCRLLAGALVEPAWGAYAEVRGLAPDSVGGPIQADTPFARSVEDLETLGLFTVQIVQERWDDAEYFHLGDVAYRVLTLESGERVAALVNADNCQYEGKVTIFPVGRWVPWPLNNQELDQLEWQGLGLSVTTHYVDMEGSGQAKTAFFGWFPWVGMLGLWIAAVALILLVVFVVLRPVRECTRARNDVEKWLASAHALWAQSLARYNQLFPSKRPLPLRFGGLPSTPYTRWLIRYVLKSSWEVTNYQELLETVDYMTQGPGFTNCQEQETRAWQLSRASSLLGMAMVMNWAGRAELVDRSRAVCRQIQGQFSSWDEFYLGFLAYFAGVFPGEGAANDKEAVQHRVDCYWELKNRPDGPYSLPWNLDLGGTN